MFGPAPILDFDGTIANLPVDWKGLREMLSIASIEDLWSRGRDDWGVVAEAELMAASHAVLVAPVATILATVRSFAVLTSNDARAVYVFVDRFPALKERLSIVIGREELAGPKTDFAYFELGMLQCLEATRSHRSGDQAVYVGDSPYELTFALRMGLKVLDVLDLTADSEEGRE